MKQMWLIQLPLYQHAPIVDAYLTGGIDMDYIIFIWSYSPEKIALKAEQIFKFFLRTALVFTVHFKLSGGVTALNFNIVFSGVM